MKFGVTERGDASRDLSWAAKMDKVDAALLITKNVSDEFIEHALKYRNTIVHITCTGYGGTVLEPNVEPYQEILDRAQKLVSKGYPTEQIVIRVDPIFPTERGIDRARNVIDAAVAHGFHRFRVSVVDMYPHVRARFEAANVPSPYGEGRFTAGPVQFAAVDAMLAEIKAKYSGIMIECCAEPMLHSAEHCGCISTRDVEILGMKLLPQEMQSDFHQRRDCMCIPGKTELLTNRHQCENRCLYCYWN